MNTVGRGIVTGLLLVAGSAAGAMAQEASMPEVAAAQEEIDKDAANRAYIQGVLGRDEVRSAARVAGVDVDRALAGVDGLEGERLERATQQAQLVDQHLGQGQAQDRIVLSVTTVIVILLLVLIIVLVAN